MARMLSLPPRRNVIGGIYYAVAVAFFVYIFHYYWTSAGGPTLLAMTLIPVTYVLFILQALRDDELYPRLPPLANYAIAATYIAFSCAVAYYMNTQYISLGTERAGMWDHADLIMGGGMTLLIMEYARKRHVPLFILNIALVLYAVYGYMIPGMFHHAGLTWDRVTTAMSVEMATGIFSRLPQIALTIIGSFLLVLSLLRGYGCIGSLLRATKRIAVTSPHALPQSAVIGSMCVGTVSGSGAANAITIGSATIPAMIGAGMPPATAAAIEVGLLAWRAVHAAGDGNLGFSDGRVPGQGLFRCCRTGLGAGNYLLYDSCDLGLLAGRSIPDASRRWLVRRAGMARPGKSRRLRPGCGQPNHPDGCLWIAPMFAALYVFIVVAIALFVVNLVPLLGPGRWSLRAFIDPIRRFLDAYTEMISDLALLLATLSIMTGALVITGVPTKLGSLLIDAAGINLAAMVALSFIFGALLGTGLPPAPTYILVAIVIAPPMIQHGVNPWVVHFFAFFLGVFGELTPPTSLVAAITAKIANASFYATLNRALQICISLFTLMVGVFVRPELVIEPGLSQLGPALLILLPTLGITFSMQAQFADRATFDVLIRLTIAAFALLALLHPDEELAIPALLPVCLFIGYWLLRRRNTVSAERTRRLETTTSLPAKEAMPA